MKTVLRIFVVLMLIVSTTLGFSSTPAQAGIIDQISQVYTTAKTGGKAYFCRKGDAFKGIFSTRSFEGELCSNSRAFAALAEYTCSNPNVEGFEGSQCDQKAKQKLGGADPKAVLKQEYASATGAAKQLIDLFYKG